MSTSPPFKVGVIGYGLSAKIFHIPFVTTVPALKLHAIVQRSPKPDDDAGKDHPGVRSYKTSDELFKDGDIDVVVVTSTPNTHFELAKAALEHGKHVVVEKPFVPTYSEAEELIAIAKKHERLLTVFQNRRWDSDFLTVMALLKEGKLGRVVEFETHFDRHRPIVSSSSRAWKSQPMAGGAAIYDLGTHLIDQVVVALGLPKRITGIVTSQREDSAYEDSFTVLLHYDGGLLATAKAGVVSPEVSQLRFWVRGTEGSYKKYHLDVQEPQLLSGKRPGDTGYGIEPEDHNGTLNIATGSDISSTRFPTVDPPTYKEFYVLFANALQGKGDVPVEAESAAQVIRLIELARQSSKEGRSLDV